MVLCEDRTGIGKQLNQRVFACAGQPGNRADAHALNHHAKDLGALFKGERVHEYFNITHNA